MRDTERRGESLVLVGKPVQLKCQVPTDKPCLRVEEERAKTPIVNLSFAHIHTKEFSGRSGILRPYTFILFLEHTFTLLPNANL